MRKTKREGKVTLNCAAITIHLLPTGWGKLGWDPTTEIGKRFDGESLGAKCTSERTPK